MNVEVSYPCLSSTNVSCTTLHMSIEYKGRIHISLDVLLSLTPTMILSFLDYKGSFSKPGPGSQKLVGVSLPAGGLDIPMRQACFTFLDYFFHNLGQEVETKSKQILIIRPTVFPQCLIYSSSKLK